MLYSALERNDNHLGSDGIYDIEINDNDTVNDNSDDSHTFDICDYANDNNMDISNSITLLITIITILLLFLVIIITITLLT